MHRGLRARSVRPSGFRGIFREDEQARAVYAEGAGIARALPAAIAVPNDARDAAALVAWARSTRTALIPRGSGSGMAGGAVGTGVVVDMSRIDWMADVDVGGRRLWVGPGALRGAVQAEAARHALRFPVDPSSGAFCTLGGMVATNAAGARTLRYGATREWVVGLDCLFDDGTRATIRRGAPPPAQVPALRRFLEHGDVGVRASAQVTQVAHEVRKESSGYAVPRYARGGDLIDLLVGSEGTLALFVGVELALAPAAAATSSLLAAFPSLDAAVEGAALAREAGASACELLDRTFLEVAAMGEALGGGGATAQEMGGVSAGSLGDAEAVLLIEVEGATREDAASAATRLERGLGDAGASLVRLALDTRMERALWALRHAASPLLSRLDPSLKSMQLIEDACVPPRRLADYVRGVRDALAARGTRGVIFGHAGDAHVHVNPLVDVRRRGWRGRIDGLLLEVTGLVASLGGTLAGEHGDGRLRTPLLERVWRSPAPAMFASVKQRFDPVGIFNPGVKVPLPGQRAIEDVKYDPALPALPDRARAALQQVERERAYGRFRLSLLDQSG